MRAAIDIDRTLTAWPDLMCRIMDACEYRVLLTGYSGHARPYAVSMQERVQQVQPLLGGREVPIHIAVGKTLNDIARGKGEFCRDNSIDICYEDTQLYADAIRRISPKTCVVMIQK